MFKPGKIKVRFNKYEHLYMDGMINDVLGIGFHPILRNTVMHRRCPQGWMYTCLLTGGAIPVYPMPADAETAAMFAMKNPNLIDMPWDERNKLAQEWKRAGLGQWADVLPESSVI